MENTPANDVRPRRGILHSYRAKLIISFAAILGLMLVATLLIQLFGIPFSGYGGIYHQIKKENERTLSLGADMAKDRLISLFNERKGDALVLAEGSMTKTGTERLCRFMNGDHKKEGFDLSTFKKLPEYAAIEQRIRLIMAAYFAYESIKIADAATQKIMVSTSPNEVGLPVPVDALLKEPIGTGEQYIDLMQDKDKRYWIYIAHPIRSGTSGKPIAVAILKIHAEEMITPVLRIVHGLGEGAEVVFADKDMNIFAAISAQEGVEPVAQSIASAPPTTPVTWGVKGQEGIKVAIDYRGVEVLAAYRHIPISKQETWGLTIKKHTADIYAATTVLVTYFVGVYLIMAALFLWIAAGIAKNLASPIETLAQLARRVGKGESDVRAPAFDGEPGILAENFNMALANIEVNTRKLRNEIEEHKLTVAQLREAEERARAIMEELRRKTEQLERSNKELEQFAYVSSHDLQEPLRTITSYVQLLEKRYKSHLDEKADMYINFVTDAARRMQRLINDLLNFSRVGSRGKPFAPVRMEDLVGSIIVSQKIQNPDAVITHGKLPDIVADEMQIMQVFQNLIVNAVKFHGAEPPRIDVGAAEDGKEWTFWVRDNGIGIDPKYFEKIFIVFQRLHTQSEYPGTGIGLALVKKVVERHGGRIWVESEPGKGTTFWFTISKEPHKSEGIMV